ncbi:YciI family protein [Microbacterium sp. B2969]|uniref:YciI family protein n=1 Tax=Microbacterium alkaliflavum TaxID=3248839 RepID=A0ABW7QCB6_9MICO
MTNYLILYRAEGTAADQMTEMSPEDGAASMQAWMDWQAKAGDAVVDFGSPTQPVAGADESSKTSVGGYSLMQADSLDDLQALLEDHPHKAQGGSIEVLELLEIPGM